MSEQFSELHVGSPGSGKSQAGAKSLAEEDGASVTLDPHEASLARTALIHVTGNVLWDQLANVQRTLCFNLLEISQNPDLLQRQLEIQRRVDGFSAIALLRTGADDMAGTPLREEWFVAVLMLFLHQKSPKLPTLLPFALMPGTPEFESLVSDCTLPEFRAKFRGLEKLTPRALRSEVGSAVRLIGSIFRSTAFQVRCRDGFDLGAFLQNKGKLIIESSDEVSQDAMRVIMGAIVLKTIEHAKSRPRPYPIIRVRLDEANNARLVTPHVLRGIAELRKYGLFFSFYVQNLNFPGSVDEVLQNCRVHHWYGCSNYDLARKAATDVASGLGRSDEQSRADRIAELTEEIMRFKPGQRWSVYPWGSRKEQVAMLQHPVPDWPGLRQKYLEDKLCQIYARPEYQTHSALSATGDPATSASSISLNDILPPPSKSPRDSSPAERLRRKKEKPVDGSSANGNEGESP